MDMAPAGLPRSGTVLHAGCGGNPLPPWLTGWAETRLDIDSDCEPDVVASMTDMGEVGEFDMVYSSHALEHLHPYDVGKALGEFRRVLKPGGLVVAMVPDLGDVRPTSEVVYESPGGPITGLDMYYGKQSLTATQPYMTHRTGFVRQTLGDVIAEAGFAAVAVTRCDGFSLLGIGRK